MSVRYPVAASADAALSAALGHAAREREARAFTDEGLSFVTEAAGPAFATREAALDAYGGRLEDERPGRTVRVDPENRWCELAETALEVGRHDLAPSKPVFADGRRWPAARAAVATAWRLQVSYWKVGAQELAPVEQARSMRRASDGGELDARQLRALSLQRLQPIKPQQPLDVGLFERRLPEAPHITMADE